MRDRHERIARQRGVGRGDEAEGADEDEVEADVEHARAYGGKHDELILVEEELDVRHDRIGEREDQSLGDGRDDVLGRRVLVAAEEPDNLRTHSDEHEDREDGDGDDGRRGLTQLLELTLAQFLVHPGDDGVVDAVSHNLEHVAEVARDAVQGGRREAHHRLDHDPVKGVEHVHGCVVG